MAERQLTNALKEFDEKYYSNRLPPDVIQNFGSNLTHYIADLLDAQKKGETEEHTKNIINNFLKRNFYREDAYIVNTSDRIDSSIQYHGKPLALFEVKRVGAKSEMASQDNLNKKALWELAYYYLNETRITDGAHVVRKSGLEIRRLIVTDGLKWLLIDANDFEKLCDVELEDLFFKYRNRKLTYSEDNAKFYEDVRHFFDRIDITQKLPFVFFDLLELYKAKKNWSLLYKAYSREFFLKEGFRPRTTQHSLNERFYQELLYIMGLKEVTEKGKTLIQIDNSIQNSFAQQVFHIYTAYKEVVEESAVEKTFELIILWLNRLLFIKLFEGQLIAFNSDDPSYHILDNEKIRDFQNLQDLFFEVLGRRSRPEGDKFYDQFEMVPYLNSSLFERQKIESSDININELKNYPVIRKSNSVLGKKGKQEIPLLEYTIDFLNSYCFAARSSDHDTDEQDRDIIDAAVLGLIFEKLNGYKDGSHYTPSLITEYMCKEAIEEIVLRKINEGMGWHCHTLLEVKDKTAASLDTAQQVNEIINSVKICDPAVGSGHFLVSALNRLIAIKWELGVLFKFGTQERLREYKISVEDDILCITDGQGHPFAYDKGDYLSQQIQETLFNEKRTLIEDCLFGVDLNPKAVSICNLRLWVELLKNAYYKNGVMETLPNIDINIKCGNSLISRMGFDPGKKLGGKDVSFDKTSKALLKDYKQQVKKYKAAADKAEKKVITRTIEQLKAELHNYYIQLSLFEVLPLDTVDVYHNAFEWAFEFPEVISEDGVFLGFDGIIGNPPYIQLQSMKEEADKLKEMHYATYNRMGDIYCLFFELGWKLLNARGVLSFITSNKWMRAGYGEALRGFLAEHTNPMLLIDFAGNKIFDSATVDVNILTFDKSKNKGETRACIIKGNRLENLSVKINVTPPQAAHFLPTQAVTGS